MEEKLKSMQIAVCTAPGGNGFCLEYMPDFLKSEDFDNCAPHIHNFYEIIWFEEGEGIQTIDFQDYEVRPNTIFFLSPGMIHHFDHNANYKGVSIKLCSDIMRSDEKSNNILLKYNFFHAFNDTPCFHIDDETAAELRLVLREMEKEIICTDMLGNEDIMRALLRIFLVKVQRHGIREGEYHLDTLKPSHRLFISFRRMVEKEYARMHTVQEYADQLHVAVRTLNKSVNECSSMSPLSFINQRILLEAKRLVRYSNLMIKEIAFELGFDDPSYFVKFFKRQTGYLPLEFREIEQ